MEEREEIEKVEENEVEEGEEDVGEGEENGENGEGEEGDGGLEKEVDDEITRAKHAKNAEMIKEKVKAFKEKQMKKGVCYMSRVPPYMKVSMIRRLLKPYGVERIYLEPEKDEKRRERKRRGGNKARCYVEGWIEFADKHVAKMVAVSLNGQKMVANKHSFYAEDCWNLKYLAMFKWENLIEKLGYDRRVRDQRMQAELTQSKKETDFFLEKVEQSKIIMGMHKKNQKKRQKVKADEEEKEEREGGRGGEEFEGREGDGGEEDGEDGGEVKGGGLRYLKKRKFHQRKPIKRGSEE